MDTDSWSPDDAMRAMAAAFDTGDRGEIDAIAYLDYLDHQEPSEDQLTVFLSREAAAPSSAPAGRLDLL